MNKNNNYSMNINIYKFKYFVQIDQDIYLLFDVLYFSFLYINRGIRKFVGITDKERFYSSK